VSRPRLLVPAVSTAIMLVLLLGLGIWQVRRLAWKEGILAQIAAAERRPAEPLVGEPSPFAKVAATGHLRPDLTVRFGAELHEEMPGTQIVVPLERPGQPTLLVDLGWVPEHGPPPVLPTGKTVTVAGFVHPAAHPGWFAATDDPKGRHFYTLDPAAIGEALGLASVAPFTLVALGPPPTVPGAPIPAEHLPRPPNNHLQYALTWFGLAAVLVVVFATYARKALRA
jgi:surfeit locus 1 family protein